MRLLSAGLVAGAVTTPASQAAVVPQGTPVVNAGNTFVIRDARIFDGQRWIERGSGHVVRGRIASVGRAVVPRGTPVYDGRGKTVMPGLADAHVHTDDEGRRDALRFGVTTQLDMFSDVDGLAQLPAAKRLRRSLKRTDLADLWSVGIGVTVPGGYPIALEIPRLTPGTNPGRFVADRIREGSDYIKIVVEDGSINRPLPTLTPQQVQAVVTTAHERRRLAVAHAEAIRSAKIAMDAGADGLVHVFRDTEVDTALVSEIRDRGTFVVATLAVFDCGLGANDLLADERVATYLSEAQIATLKSRNPGCQRNPDWHRIAMENVRRLHAAGVPILTGTDTPLAGTAHGVSVLAEVERFTSAGMTAQQALATANRSRAGFSSRVDSRRAPQH
ncbi:amidohydrolase family protein [Actinomadura spongiicola]|nr:amidohydrolase family protein [Actinomadura spongiicola]